ncbi:MAG TPA: hypothetical protein VGN07_22465 [Steroidobacteraceae bacterium]|jgi:hypothetical protein
MEPMLNGNSADPFRTAEETRLSGYDTLLARVAGLLLCPFGLAVLGLAVFLGYRGLTAGTDFPAVLAVMTIFALIGVFCAVTGYRLLFNRPNRYGSLLSPIGWWILSGLFAAMALGLAVFVLESRKYDGVAVPLISGGFAYQSYRAGLAARRRRAVSDAVGA